MYGNLAYIASEKLTINFDGLFTLSESSMDEVQMPDPLSVAKDTDPAGFFSARDYTYEDMHTYSNLDYTYFRGGVGFDYRFNAKFLWSTKLDYYDLKDDNGDYVYGDESGSYVVIRSGIEIGL